MSRYLRPTFPASPLRFHFRSSLHALPRSRPLISPLRRPLATSASAPQPLSKNAQQRNALIAAALLTTSAILYYYTSPTSPSSAPSQSGLATGSQFTINIRGSSGIQPYTFNRISPEAAEALFHEHEESLELSRPGNPVSKVERNWLGSNEPCEDRMASDLVPRSTGASFDPGRKIQEAPALRFESGYQAGSSPTAAGTLGGNDLVMVSVFDGHAGDATSKLLAKALHPTMTVALAGLQAGYLPTRGGEAVWQRVMSKLNPFASLGGKELWTPENVSRTIQQAFVQLDENICFSPIRLLPTLSNSNVQQAHPRSTPSSPSPLEADTKPPTDPSAFIALAQPADAGACAISALIDSASDGLYVASAGDCRAVAGWQTGDGKWRCDVLSEDQMGENPKEVARMQAEHPSEKDTVIRNGRVQGALQPTRAFGDAVYKWSPQQANAVADVFREHGLSPRKQRPDNLTPPYVTAQPDVAYRKIHPGTGENLKFLILATDGLWDRITSEEAVLLLASHLANSSRPNRSSPEYINRLDLPKHFPLQPPTEPRPYPAQDLPGTGPLKQTSGNWVYEDNNAATHLIRNSLAGADLDERIKLLSLKQPVTRWMRDDISVQVIFFNDEDVSAKK